jgi:Domain of unknown function (DUF3303)
MKYVVAWTNRDSGSTEAGAKRSLSIFSKWSPSAGATFHQFVGRVDGEGGFAVVETDNPTDILRDVSLFAPWLKYEVYPVVDIAEVATLGTEAIKIRESIS